jgi:FeS assembly SUF system regulator
MLKLSRMTDYAVVILTAMARPENNLAAASALAEQTGLAEPTVAKILKLLAKGGVVSSQRGAAGGYKLERAPDRLSMADVIAAIEGPVELTACVDGSADSCALEKVCCVKGRWNPVNAAIKSALEKVSLADMRAQR